MIKCIVNAVEYEIFGNFELQEQLGNVISSNFTILIPSGTVIPKGGDIVRVTDTTTSITYFFGEIGLIDSPEFNSFTEIRRYVIKARNANALLKRRIVNYARQNATLTQIVQDLYDDIIAEEGITLGTISNSDLEFEAYVAPNLDLQMVLNELASRAGATWIVTNDGVFNFIIQENFPKLDRIFTEETAFGNRLKQRNTSLDLRTVQIIDGATNETTLQTETFTYSENQSSFFVGFGVARKPTIIVNGQQVDADRIGVVGLDSDDESRYFLFAFNSTQITYNQDSNFLSADDSVVIQYIGIFSVRIQVDNQERIDEISAITGTSGRIERILNDSSIRNFQDGQSFAESLLENFGESRDELTFTVYASNLRKIGLTTADFAINTEIEFDMPDRGIVDSFVIVERTIVPQSLNDVINNLQIRLKLQNRNLLRSYGQTFNDIERQLTSISVREDEIIIQSLNLTEDFTMTEETLLVEPDFYYPTASGTGDIFIPAWFGGDGGAFAS